jgi:carbon-monoxide dehydrogenase medium subunit
MTIAIISAAAAVEITSEGVLKAVRVAVGAVAPTVVRLYQAESLLAGRKLDEIRWDRVETCIGQEISPIDDIRASQTYRQKAVVVLVQRTLEKAVQDAWRRSA